MPVHLTTCLWGPWHLEIMERSTLPTLLAPGNLPALARRMAVRYRIATTPADRERISAWPIFRRLAETVEVDFVAEHETPDIIYHVEWYHQAAAGARADAAFWLLVPPDVAWSDGTLSHVADAIEAGKSAIAMPYLRVVSETCLPEIVRCGRPGEPLAIPPGELVRLAVRHLHPLSAAVLARGRHSRPSLEALWRVPGEGLVFRHMVRELLTFDPRRIVPTHLWYAGSGCTIDDIRVVTDSDDMFMLSFAPLLKDIPLYIPEHAVAPMDLARQSLHPLNDTPLTSAFARHSVRLHYGAMDEARWRRIERRSDAFFKQAIVMREILRVWAALQGRGCDTARQLMSVALQGTSLARRWPDDGPVTVFVPNDAALARLDPGAVRALIAPEANERLVRAVLGHVVSGTRVAVSAEKADLRTLGGGSLRLNGEARVVESLEVPPHRIHIVDRWLAAWPVAEAAP